MQASSSMGGASNDPLSPLADDPAAATPEASTGQRKAQGAEESGDHWNAVLERLAPKGFAKSPAWQRTIIEKVVKQMTRRQKEEVRGMSREAMARTIDLGALGISAEAAASIRSEELRVAMTMSNLPGPEPLDDDLGPKPEPTQDEKQLADRNNQVHYYIRAIQMEQLLEQDLDADLKQVKEEVSSATNDRDNGQAKAVSLRSRLERQVQIVKKRCDALTAKASEVSSDNSGIRLSIDDLRKEKIAHRELLTRMKAKAAKMDEDIAFLTHAAHSALDQREKVRGKFLMAQRDMQQEREQKLAVIQELIQRAGALDDDWGARQAQLDDAEEARRRQFYKDGRKRRSDLESAEVRYGFQVAQCRGWESEFERLQAFTCMDAKFTPGEGHIVDEITSRYGEKERANTSLLRYLNEQQLEVAGMAEQRREYAARNEELQLLLGGGGGELGGGESPEEVQALAEAEAEKAAKLEGLLDAAAASVSSSARCLWRTRDAAPKPVAEGRCSVSSLEAWLQALEGQLFSVHGVCQAAVAGKAGSDVQPPPVLREWCARERVPKHPKVTVPEIHDALCQQALMQKRHGDDIDEEDDEAEKAREESSKKSPFQRVKVNKAKERQQIIEWARKRQGHVKGVTTPGAPGAQEVRKAINAAARPHIEGSEPSSSKPTGAAVAGSGAAALRGSASAPALRTGAAPAAGALRGSASRADLPAIGEASAASGSRAAERRAAAERAAAAAAYTARHGAPPPVSASAADLQQAAPPRQPRGKATKRLQNAGSASMPQLSASAAAPKDLGTVIYLLGTQSNSMNARKFLRNDGGA